MFGRGDNVVWTCKQQSCCLGGVFFFVYFVVFGIVQWLMFHWATINCGALPDNFKFHSGEPSKNGTASFNHMPEFALIEGREPSLYGDAFDVFSSTKEGMMTGAPVGTWFRTWGPWFYTYTYQETLSSKGTVYMRPTVWGMMGVMTELKVMRCDGKGDVMKYSEGTAVFGNRMRQIFQTNTGRFLRILRNGKMVAVAEETYHGQKSVTFRTENEKGKDEIGSCILRGVNSQGYNEWFMKNDFDTDLPYYETVAIAVDYAFKIHTENKKKASHPEEFLAAMREIAGHALGSSAEETNPASERKQEEAAKLPAETSQNDEAAQRV
jgi:hypothetical protein